MSRCVLRRMHLVCLGLLALSYAVRVFLVFRGAHHPGILCNTFARLDPIALGALAAFTLDGATPVMRTSHRILLLAGCPILLVVLGVFGRADGGSALFTYPLVSCATLLMLLATVGFPIPFRKHLLVGAGIHLGKISYGLYVFHDPVIVLLKSSPLPPIALPVAAFGVTAGIASLSYRYFEAPFLRLKTRYSHVTRPPGLDRAMVAKNAT
jgi:peptidoglycan/LPS O-acetylase OafA/YrhL